jgi:hypothetical protein
VLTWVNRITREQVRDLDLFGKWASRWRCPATSGTGFFRKLRAVCERRADTPQMCRLNFPQVS